MATGNTTTNNFLSPWETKDNYVSVRGFSFWEIQWGIKPDNNATLIDPPWLKCLIFPSWQAFIYITRTEAILTFSCLIKVFLSPGQVNLVI